MNSIARFETRVVVAEVKDVTEKYVGTCVRRGVGVEIALRYLLE